MSDPQKSRWLDNRLRDVPVPDALLRRLHRLGTIGDEELDAELRRVPLPAGLMASLRRIGDDEKLDRALCDVPIPDGLAARLREAVEDEQLDERLRDVRVPANMLSRTRRLLWERPRRRHVRLSQLAVAASLLVMIGGSYFLAMAHLVLTAYRSPEPRSVLFVSSEPPLQLDVRSGVEVEIAPAETDIAARPTAVAVADEVRLELPADLRHGRIEEVLAPFQGELRLTDCSVDVLYRNLVCNPQRAGDDMPDLMTVRQPVHRGLEMPVVRGYDRKFLVTERTHPVIALGTLGSLKTSLDVLRTSRVPLWTETFSYDLTEQLLSEGRLPDASQVRVEDFLAAMDYRFGSVEPGSVELRTAAGPSVFGQRGAKLLQVGVVAGPVASRTLEATYLTVVVDTSASTRCGDRLKMTRRAIGRLVRQLGPRDRISVVAYSDKAHVLFEDAGREYADALVRSIDSLSPEGATNIGAGLRLASSVAMRAPLAGDVARRMVLISDGAMGISPSTEAQMCDLLAEVAREGAELEVIDLSGTERGDPTLAKLGGAGGRGVVLADSADRIEGALLATLVGGSPVVAEDAALRVTFNPKAVAAYRLLGHEATAMPVAAETPLWAGQTATALYEVWLWPNSVEQVAVAELAWRDPQTGQSRTARQPISRLQFATSLEECPLSLQAAALAAETAEILRQSPFAGTRDLAGVLDTAERVNPRLAERPSLGRLLQLVRQAERVRTRGESAMRPEE